MLSVFACKLSSLLRVKFFIFNWKNGLIKKLCNLKFQFSSVIFFLNWNYYVELKKICNNLVEGVYWKELVILRCVKN